MRLERTIMSVVASLLVAVGPAVAQSSSTTNKVYIEQVGNTNTLTLTQSGSGNSIGVSSSDYATITGSTNSVTMTQTGDNNKSQYKITGNTNVYTSVVTGNSNDVMITCGTSNGACTGVNINHSIQGTAIKLLKQSRVAQSLARQKLLAV